MDNKIEEELRFRIATLETQVQALERELKEMNEGVNSLLREMITTLRQMGGDGERGAKH